MPRKFKRRLYRKKKGKMHRPRRTMKNSMVVSSNPKSNGGQIFPSIYRTLTTTHIAYNNGAITKGYYMTFKGNSYYLMGPQINYTGAFASNVPSGLVYLLSSGSSAGAVAPYTAARVKSSKITLRHACNSSNTNVPFYVIIVPSAKSDLSGLSITQWQEQPYAKTILVPSQISVPYTLKRSMSTQRMFGQEYKSNMEDNEYFCTALSDPIALWYWHIYVVSANNTTVFDSYLDVQISYATDFVIHNQYSSATPS